jgi:hypothetical protein
VKLLLTSCWSDTARESLPFTLYGVSIQRHCIPISIIDRVGSNVRPEHRLYLLRRVIHHIHCASKGKGSAFTNSRAATDGRALDILQAVATLHGDQVVTLVGSTMISTIQVRTYVAVCQRCVWVGRIHQLFAFPALVLAGDLGELFRRDLESLNRRHNESLKSEIFHHYRYLNCTNSLGRQFSDIDPSPWPTSSSIHASHDSSGVALGANMVSSIKR